MIRNKLFIYWLCAFVIAAFILSIGHFKSSNDDSKYYTDLVVRYQGQSWQNVLTPKWGINCYGFDPSLYMRDQFPGQLILGLAIAKLGIPATQALHLLGMIFLILSIFLLVQISLQFIPYERASVLYYGLLLTPMSFSYNIRANHELGIMFFCFLSLYAGLKLSSSRYWSLISAISCAILLMIKGPFFIFGLILTFWGYFFSVKRTTLLNLIFALSLCSLLVFLAAYGYEALYQEITGQSFFLEFYKIQIQQRAMQSAHEHSYFIQKIANFYYYFSHYLIYSLVWSLLVVVTILKNIKKQEFRGELKSFLKSRISICFLTSAFSFCFIFTMSDRTATRYVFPAYYLFSAWTILLLFHISKAFRVVDAKLTQWGLHLVVPALWFLAFALHFI